MAYYVGFSHRKAKILAQFVEERVRRLPGGFVPGAGDRVYAWGDVVVPSCAAEIIRVEDGFLRSVGLGAAFAEPVSWVFDEGGLHHQADRLTRLEQIILALPDDAHLQARAESLATTVRTAGLTKYNLGRMPWQPPVAAAGAARRLLVIGQVAGDAALRAITTPTRSNLALLRAVREGHPDAFIIYKRHPDVVAGLRDGEDEEACRYADHVVGEADVEALLRWASEVHVMNSLFGFEALIRGARVVCHAIPFYAGWGLTQDQWPAPRRNVQRSLGQILAAALLLYPRYRHPELRRLCTPEAAVDFLIEARKRRAKSPRRGLQDAIKLRLGRLARALGRTHRARV